MNIGLVTDFYYPWIGGPATLLRNLGHGLAARGHSVSLLAPSPDGPTHEEMDGPVRVTRVPTFPSPFGHNLRVAPFPRNAVGRWLAECDHDVVHVHHPFPLSATATLMARRRGIPLAATNHTIPECSLWGIRGTGPAYQLAHTTMARWLIFLLGRCDMVATPTDTAAGALRRLGFRGVITSISNGVDTQRFAPGPARGELRERFGLDARPVLLYTGRLDAEKQMDIWLQAAAAVLKKSPAQFLIGGNGTDRERLERISTTLGIADAVRFCGYLADDEFPEIYRLADLYFICSPIELQSISTLEAVASGLPVVAANAQALPELVHHGRNGLLFEPGNSADAARALQRLLEDDGLQRSMGEESRAIALEHDLARTVETYEQFLVTTAMSQRGVRRSERPAIAGS